MKVNVLTLFPEMFTALSAHGISGRAVSAGLMELEFYNPRDFTEDRHRTVDDKPYGGGPGMVMMVQPLVAALEASKKTSDTSSRVVCLTPQGRPLKQRDVERLANLQNLTLVCGRYEGIDERFVERYVDEEISIGDYVVSGGELPAMILLDALIRQLPGALGSELSAEQDSFAGEGLMDCPHYTRPETVGEDKVPEVLLSGDHRKIAEWRLEQALSRTLARRPELIQQDSLSESAKKVLAKLSKGS